MNNLYWVLIIYFFSGRLIFDIMGEMKLPGFSYIILGAVVSIGTMKLSEYLLKGYSEEIIDIIGEIAEEMEEKEM